MNLILAQPADAPLLAHIHVDSWRAAYRGLVPEARLERFTYEMREERFRASLSARAEETYLVAHDDEVVGILTIGAARDADLDFRIAGEIWGVYLVPSHWRKGIGALVVREAEMMLCKRGCEMIVLWVLEKNMQARSFYETMGYHVDGAVKTVDWGVELTALRYRKRTVP
jgi:GNAT superfamily N-acetyltransferase